MTRKAHGTWLTIGAYKEESNIAGESATFTLDIDLCKIFNLPCEAEIAGVPLASHARLRLEVCLCARAQAHTWTYGRWYDLGQRSRQGRPSVERLQERARRRRSKSASTF